MCTGNYCQQQNLQQYVFPVLLIDTVWKQIFSCKKWTSRQMLSNKSQQMYMEGMCIFVCIKSYVLNFDSASN
jgi:hypothetical protein